MSMTETSLKFHPLPNRKVRKPVLNAAYGFFGSAIKHATDDKELRAILEMVAISNALSEWETQQLKRRVVSRARDLEAHQNTL